MSTLDVLQLIGSLLGLSGFVSLYLVGRNIRERRAREERLR